MDEATTELGDMIIDTAEKHNYVVHIHTSPGGSSDISAAFPFVEKYGSVSRSTWYTWAAASVAT